MRLESNLPPQEYLRKMRRYIGSFFKFGDERFTGFVVGNFFSIVYHSGYEWNRRITNEKNRAIGYVQKKSNGEGCQVRFIRLRGLTNPLSLLLMFAAIYVFGWGIHFFEAGDIDLGLWHWCCVGISVIVSLCIAVSSAVAARMTERGKYGRMVLMALLKHPEDPYRNLDLNDQ